MCEAVVEAFAACDDKKMRMRTKTTVKVAVGVENTAAGGKIFQPL